MFFGTGGCDSEKTHLGPSFPSFWTHPPKATNPHLEMLQISAISPTNQEMEALKISSCFFSNGNNDSTNLHFLGFYIDWHDFFLTWGQPGRNFSRWLHNFNGSMFINQVCRPKLKGSHKCNCGFTTYKYKAPFFSGSISPKFPVYTKQFVQRSKPKRPLTNGQHFRKKHRGFAPFRNGRVEGETPLGFRYFFPVGWPEAIADSGNWELGAQNGGCLCRGYVSSPKVYALQYYKILFH